MKFKGFIAVAILLQVVSQADARCIKVPKREVSLLRKLSATSSPDGKYEPVIEVPAKYMLYENEHQLEDSYVYTDPHLTSKRYSSKRLRQPVGSYDQSSDHFDHHDVVYESNDHESDQDWQSTGSSHSFNYDGHTASLHHDLLDRALKSALSRQFSTSSRNDLLQAALDQKTKLAEAHLGSVVSRLQNRLAKKIIEQNKKEEQRLIFASLQDRLSEPSFYSDSYHPTVDISSQNDHSSFVRTHHVRFSDDNYHHATSHEDTSDDDHHYQHQVDDDDDDEEADNQEQAYFYGADQPRFDDHDDDDDDDADGYGDGRHSSGFSSVDIARLNLKFKEQQDAMQQFMKFLQRKKNEEKYGLPRSPDVEQVNEGFYSDYRNFQEHHLPEPQKGQRSSKSSSSSSSGHQVESSESGQYGSTGRSGEREYGGKDGKADELDRHGGAAGDKSHVGKRDEEPHVHQKETGVSTLAPHILDLKPDGPLQDGEASATNGLTIAVVKPHLSKTVDAEEKPTLSSHSSSSAHLEKDQKDEDVIPDTPILVIDPPPLPVVEPITFVDPNPLPPVHILPAHSFEAEKLHEPNEIAFKNGQQSESNDHQKQGAPVVVSEAPASDLTIAVAEPHLSKTVVDAEEKPTLHDAPPSHSSTSAHLEKGQPFQPTQKDEAVIPDTPILVIDPPPPWPVVDPNPLPPIHILPAHSFEVTKLHEPNEIAFKNVQQSQSNAPVVVSEAPASDLTIAVAEPHLSKTTDADEKPKLSSDSSTSAHLEKDQPFQPPQKDEAVISDKPILVIDPPPLPVVEPITYVNPNPMPPVHILPHEPKPETAYQNGESAREDQPTENHGKDQQSTQFGKGEHHSSGHHGKDHVNGLGKKDQDHPDNRDQPGTEDNSKPQHDHHVKDDVKADKEHNLYGLADEKAHHQLPVDAYNQIDEDGEAIKRYYYKQQIDDEYLYYCEKEDEDEQLKASPKPSKSNESHQKLPARTFEDWFFERKSLKPTRRQLFKVNVHSKDGVHDVKTHHQVDTYGAS